MMRLVEYPMQAVAPTVAAILGLPKPASAEARPIRPVVRDLAGVDRVAVLGVDALGLAIRRHWAQQMPFLEGLADHRQATLRAVMPSVTPVNFGCMVTGAGVRRHGAHAFDRDFRCQTLFDLLRAAGKTSAGFGRRGWTGHELLGRFADLSNAGPGENDDDVDAGLAAIVEEARPDFLIVQYGATDEVFHAHGPYSDEAGEAVAAADAWLARRVPALRGQGYGVLVLADHGQHAVVDDDGVTNGNHGTDSDEDCLTPLIWVTPTQ
ncbi:MAG: alkaline phosphatase family protein [Candidatus Hydrogenedentes bacterium]|nr:alkaline phosphatase family protein [Candidatus Hydrogenedentota bacterium]